MNEALKIFKRLLENGEVNDSNDTELFLLFKDNKIRDILQQFETELEFKLVETPHAVYMVPDIENDVLCVSMKSIREGISQNARLLEAYTQCYIIMVLLFMFYGGKNNDPKQRPFLLLRDLTDELDKRLGDALKWENTTENASEATLEERYSVNFSNIAREWADKPVYDENRRKTRSFIVITACKLLEKEKLLLIIDEEREIRPTQKLDDLMFYYYLGEQRVSEIHALFAKGGY